MELVNHVVEELEKRGHRCWLDKRGIAGSEAWRNSIAQALHEAKAVLFFGSSSSYASKYVIAELTVAHSKQRRILPLRLDHSEIPVGELELLLLPLHYIRVRDRRDTEALDQIDSDLRQIVQSPDSGELPRPIKTRKEHGAGFGAASWIVLLILLAMAAASPLAWKSFFAQAKSETSKPKKPAEPSIDSSPKSEELEGVDDPSSPEIVERNNEHVDPAPAAQEASNARDVKDTKEPPIPEDERTTTQPQSPGTARPRWRRSDITIIPPGG